MGLALSTSWNAFRHENGANLLFEIEKIGFKNIELSFNLTAHMVRQIKKTAKNSGVKIISLHNFCPIPDIIERRLALPDCYSMSSCDQGERERSVRYTKITIDTAKDLGAKAVVLHCGRVQMPDKTRELVDLFLKGLNKSGEFDRLKEDFIAEREKLCQPYLSNTLKSLEEINEHARRNNILLGVETRFYYREIPTLKEIGIILEEFKNSNISYWHDTGHAELMENIGLAKHKDYLDLYSNRMLGIHLHDILNCNDHMAPSKGSLNFSSLKPYLKKETLKVLEAHHPATAEDLREARDFLEGLFDESV